MVASKKAPEKKPANMFVVIQDIDGNANTVKEFDAIPHQDDGRSPMPQNLEL
jgi:hypothetical protein